LLAATVSLVAISTPATADSLSGFYLGAAVTAGQTVEGTAVENAQADNPGDSDTVGASDQFGSVDLRFGYNKVLDNKMLIGIEGNYSVTGIDENVIDESSVDNVVDVSQESAYGLRGKLGAAVLDNVALYGILGYQKTEFEVDVGDNAETNDHGGMVYGFGVTYAVAPNILMTGEAIQTDLDDEEYFGETDIEIDSTSFTVGVAYRFDL
jgi:opacity protein-like surface antigen